MTETRLLAIALIMLTVATIILNFSILSNGERLDKIEHILNIK